MCWLSCCEDLYFTGGGGQQHMVLFWCKGMRACVLLLLLLLRLLLLLLVCYRCVALSYVVSPSCLGLSPCCCSTGWSPEWIDASGHARRPLPLLRLGWRACSGCPVLVLLGSWFSFGSLLYPQNLTDCTELLEGLGASNCDASDEVFTSWFAVFPSLLHLCNICGRKGRGPVSVVAFPMVRGRDGCTTV